MKERIREVVLGKDLPRKIREHMMDFYRSTGSTVATATASASDIIKLFFDLEL